MGEARHKDDPLNSEVIERKVRAKPVGEVLENLQAGALEAVSDEFFDGGAIAEKNPITKRAHIEASGVRVTARRTTPPVEAAVSIDVRCDHVEPEADVYQVRGRGHVACEDGAGKVEHEFSVPVDVHEDDGRVELDSNEVRNQIANEIANAIRS